MEEFCTRMGIVNLRIVNLRIVNLQNGTSQPGGAAMYACTTCGIRILVSHLRNLLYRFKKRETNGDGSCDSTIGILICQIQNGV